MGKQHQYNYDKSHKIKERDYVKDKHELLLEDQAHIDSIKQEMLNAYVKQQSEVK